MLYLDDVREKFRVFIASRTTELSTKGEAVCLNGRRCVRLTCTNVVELLKEDE